MRSKIAAGTAYVPRSACDNNESSKRGNAFALSSHASFSANILQLTAALRRLEVPERANVERRIDVAHPADIKGGTAPCWKMLLVNRFASFLGIESALEDLSARKPEQATFQTNSSKLVRSRDVDNEQDEAFMSYSRDDSNIMQKVLKRLATSGISVWTDDKVVPGTPSWKKAVQAAIENSTFFIILLTPSAKNSDIVAMELGYALAHGRIILPVLAGENNRTAVPLEIINRQWTDIREEFEVGMTRLVQAITAYRGACHFFSSGP